MAPKFAPVYGAIVIISLIGVLLSIAGAATAIFKYSDMGVEATVSDWQACVTTPDGTKTCHDVLDIPGVWTTCKSLRTRFRAMRSFHIIEIILGIATIAVAALAGLQKIPRGRISTMASQTGVIVFALISFATGAATKNETTWCGTPGVWPSGATLGPSVPLLISVFILSIINIVVSFMFTKPYDLEAVPGNSSMPYSTVK